LTSVGIRQSKRKKAGKDILKGEKTTRNFFGIKQRKDGKMARRLSVSSNKSEGSWLGEWINAYRYLWNVK